DPASGAQESARHEPVVLRGRAGCLGVLARPRGRSSMKNVCALIPLLFALPVAGGCAGAKPVQSPAGEGGSGAGTSTGTGGSTGSGGGQVTGSGGSQVTGSGGGGLLTGSGGGGGDIGPESDAGNNCGLQQFAPTPKAADIMMVLDR